MAHLHSPSQTLVFIGDSITDSGRITDPSGHLGAGYVRRIDGLLRDDGQDARVINTGVGGDRVRDLRARFAADVIEHAPDILTIMIGVNDTWRRYDSGLETTAAEFEDDYSAVLERAREQLDLRELVLMEPFLAPITEEQRAWLEEDLDPKIAVTRDLATRYGARLVGLSDLFAARADTDGPITVVIDGVHPTAAGHELIAQAWLSSRADGAA